MKNYPGTNEVFHSEAEKGIDYFSTARFRALLSFVKTGNAKWGKKLRFSVIYQTLGLLSLKVNNVQKMKIGGHLCGPESKGFENIKVSKF